MCSPSTSLADPRQQCVSVTVIPRKRRSPQTANFPRLARRRAARIEAARRGSVPRDGGAALEFVRTTMNHGAAWLAAAATFTAP